MKKLAEIYIRFIQKWLPSPLSIAFLLTGICLLLALILTKPVNQDPFEYSLTLMNYWGNGIWGLLTFTAQMMFILVMGHAIALSKPAQRLIDLVLSLCTSHAKAVFTVTIITVISGFINWGFGLIFGAILSRKVYEYGQKNGISMNYPLLAACGYTGMMIWHGGLSGSAPLTVAQAGHSLEARMGVISLSETIFSSMNIAATLACLALLPLFSIWLSKLAFQPSEVSVLEENPIPSKTEITEGAEKLDRFPWVGLVIGLGILGLWIYQFTQSASPMNYLGINTINLLFLAIALVCHGSLFSFIQATDEAIRGASGILIQFPLYAGIMGIMSGSGLLHDSAVWLSRTTEASTFPFYSYLSASLVNILIPSGGGQWQIQGPILIDAANSLGVSLGKTTMSLAYGDQLTNMLQPFWALPLLSVTGLKAKDILPYSMMFMMVGAIIFGVVLLLF